MSAASESVECAWVSTLAGSPRDVRRRLDHVKAERVVAIALAHATQGEADAIAETFANVANFVRQQLGQLDRQVLESLVSVLVPKAPPTPTLLKEAAMLARARKAVLEGADWLTAAQIAKLAGFSESNPSAQPNKWKREGTIFAIRHNGIDYFPGYGLDPTAGYRPLKTLAKVIQAFDGGKDGWGMAYWFLSANGFLGGKRPQDLLATRPEAVIAAAADEHAGIAHG